MTERQDVCLKMEEISGYGASGNDGIPRVQLDEAFDEDLSGGRAVTLKIVLGAADADPLLKDVAAIAFPNGRGTLTMPVLTAPRSVQERMGGLFFALMGNSDLRKKRPSLHMRTPTLTLYAMRHGLVALHGNLLQSGLTSSFVAENLSRTTTLLLGRQASNHERLAFTQEAIFLLRRLTDRAEYRNIDLRIAS